MTIIIAVFRAMTQRSLINFIDVSEDRAGSTFTDEQYSRQARVILWFLIVCSTSSSIMKIAAERFFETSVSFDELYGVTILLI